MATPNLDRNIYQIQRDIRDNLESMLTNEINGGDLSDFDDFVYGSRSEVGRFSGGFPTLWMIPSSHTPTIETANQEEHPFTWLFATLVRDNDHEQGQRKAEDKNGAVYDVIAGTEDRQVDDAVHDSQPGEIIPVQEFQQNSGTFWAAFEFQFIVRRYRQSS